MYKDELVLEGVIVVTALLISGALYYLLQIPLGPKDAAWGIAFIMFVVIIFGATDEIELEYLLMGAGSMIAAGALGSMWLAGYDKGESTLASITLACAALVVSITCAFSQFRDLDAPPRVAIVASFIDATGALLGGLFFYHFF